MFHLIVCFAPATCQELFFATQENWAYWQCGSDQSKGWSDQTSYKNMLKHKSKGKKRRERGQSKGYSTTQRADKSTRDPIDLTGQDGPKTGADGAVPDGAADGGTSAAVGVAAAAGAAADGAADGAAADGAVADGAADGGTSAATNVPRGVLQLMKRSAHGAKHVAFVHPYAYGPVSWFCLGKICFSG